MISFSNVKKCSGIKTKVIFDGTLSVYTDTRKYKHPGAFVAIPGARVNPLDVISDLLKMGCPVVFFQQDPINFQKVSALKEIYPQVEFVPVDEVISFLQELAHHHVVSWKKMNSKNTIFAISGSNGKTTHKEMLSFLLQNALPGKVVSTEKNNNNHLGVPLTLLGISWKTEVVVLELGSNHPGEIKQLCDIAIPDAGITTNVGATHLEFFGTENKVFEEESYLYHSVAANTESKGLFLINLDDPYLKNLHITPGSITFGHNNLADAQITFLDDGARLNWSGKQLEARNSYITGQHNKLNLITCLFIACRLYPELEDKFIKLCQDFRPTKNRSEWITFQDRLIYLDAYNANPSSMKAALTGFKDRLLSQGYQLNDACIVLGDMNELGDLTPQYHQDLGEFVQKLGFKNVYFVGRFSSYYRNGFPDGHMKSSSLDFKSEYREDCLKKYSIHFIKGSRSLQLESLFDIT